MEPQNEEFIVDVPHFKGCEEPERVVTDVPNPNQKVEGFFRRLWNRTVFPDMIAKKRASNQVKRDEAIRMGKIQAEARKEAIEDLKPELKEHYKQQELDRLTGRNKQQTSGLQKLSQAFSLEGTSIGSTEKINQMMGTGAPLGPQQEYVQPVPRAVNSRKKRKVVRRKFVKKQDNVLDFEDKMKRIIG